MSHDGEPRRRHDHRVRALKEPVPADWRVWFGAAYTAELRAWISGPERGECVGPSAWEGYAPTKVVELASRP
jgi:hypothetical protein